MIGVEREPRQLVVAAGLIVATAVIQTIGVVMLEDFVWLWRDRVAERTSRPVPGYRRSDRWPAHVRVVDRGDVQPDLVDQRGQAQILPGRSAYEPPVDLRGELRGPNRISSDANAA